MAIIDSRVVDIDALARVGPLVGDNLDSWTGEERVILVTKAIRPVAPSKNGEFRA